MKRTPPIPLALSVCIFLVAVMMFFRTIAADKLFFYTDEAYWVSTAGTVHLLLTGDFRNDRWHEFWGFTNFNGAKFVYGLGLMIQGSLDVSGVGIAPDTYYRWRAYEGQRLPESMPIYHSIAAGRRVSAVATAVAVALMFILGYELSSSYITAAAAAAILFFHPLIQDVATHALSDGIFLSAELLYLIPLFRYVTAVFGRRKPDRFLITAAGFSLGFLVSVKINGIIFFLIGCTVLAVTHAYASRGNLITALRHAAILGMVAAGTFLILQPNLFFYPGYSLRQMLGDRISITRYHVQYFSATSPGHVTLSISEKLRSFSRNVLTWWLWIPFLPSFLTVTRKLKSRRLRPAAAIFYAAGGVCLIFLLSYVVFDEGRYYLPLLPFLAVFCADWGTILPVRQKSGRPRPPLLAVLQRLGHIR